MLCISLNLYLIVNGFNKKKIKITSQLQVNVSKTVT